MCVDEMGATYVLDVVDEAVPGGLGADVGATPGEALAGEDTDPLVAELLVLAEHEGDLARASADVTGGDVGILANVALELGHEGDTEAANLAVGLALGVEVGAALAAAHGEAGEGILEGLLEAEELEDGEAAVGNKRCGNEAADKITHLTDGCKRRPPL